MDMLPAMDSLAVFRILHVLGILLLTGFTFAAFADQSRTRRRTLLIVSGTSSLIAMISGFGLSGILKIGFPLWIVVKIVCWLGLSALAGISYRKPGCFNLWTCLTVALLVLALIMVYIQPFSSGFEGP